MARCGIDHPQPHVHPAHGVGQLPRGGVLDDESVGPGIDGATQIAGPAEGRHHQDAQSREFRANLRRHRNTVHTRHFDIEQRHIRGAAPHRLGHLVTTPHLGHDLQIRFQAEQRRQRASDQGLVIGEQQPDHRALPGAAADRIPLVATRTSETIIAARDLGPPRAYIYRSATSGVPAVFVDSPRSGTMSYPGATVDSGPRGGSTQLGTGSGYSAAMVSPPSSGAVTLRLPPSARTRSRKPVRPEPMG